jgi:iron(III) transport system substrate-binding protein
MATPPAPSSRARLAILAAAPLVVLAFLVAAYQIVWGGGDALVVYCAHDAVYAEEILRGFEEKAGVPLAIVFDTEATKSLGLVERLIREKDAPRCDVFWNNETLGTVDLAERGILAPYRGPGHARIPDGLKDPDGLWTGFAARLRVYIVNTDLMPATEEAARAALARDDLSRVAIARPLYGTTLTHYCVLWKTWGGEKLSAWHREMRDRGVQELLGNATVKNAVARGACDLGFTDTDDFFLAKDEGRPVEMLPVRLDTGEVVCIPNTVCIVKGTSRREEAERFVDFLLSEETEVALALSKSRQVPLGPVAAEKLTPEVRRLKEIAEDAFPLVEAAGARADCLAWLKRECIE